jgi:hypothetical protein
MRMSKFAAGTYGLALIFAVALAAQAPAPDFF